LYTHVSIMYTDPPSQCMCYGTLSYQFESRICTITHNKTAGNNHVLHSVAFKFKLRYCILNTVLINYSCMLSTQCQLLTTTQIYLTLLTFCI